jgi:hypothetical protein
VNSFFAAMNGDLLCASGRGLFRLPSGNLTWQAVDSAGLPYASVLQAAANSSNDLFAVSSNENFALGGVTFRGVYRKLSGAASWTKVSGPMNDSLVTALAIHRNTGQLFAGTQDGRIYYSSDKGTSWQDISEGYPFGVRVNSLEFLGDSLLTAASGGAGVFHSTHALPVELLSFSARKERDGVRLNWRTETETNNYGFSIERRPSGSGDWSEIGFVSGRGASASSSAYDYLDPISSEQVFPLQYRLKQMDNDGAFTYSPTILVSADVSLPQKLQLTVLPNPVSTEASLSFTLPQETSIRLSLYNTSGAEVQNLPVRNLAAGANDLIFKRGLLPPGSYFWVLTTGTGERITEKMILR